MVSKAGRIARLRSLRRAVDVSVDLCWAEGGVSLDYATLGRVEPRLRSPREGGALITQP